MMASRCGTHNTPSGTRPKWVPSEMWLRSWRKPFVGRGCVLWLRCITRRTGGTFPTGARSLIHRTLNIPDCMENLTTRNGRIKNLLHGRKQRIGNCKAIYKINPATNSWICGSRRRRKSLIPSIRIYSGLTTAFVGFRSTTSARCLPISITKRLSGARRSS